MVVTLLLFPCDICDPEAWPHVPLHIYTSIGSDSPTGSAIHPSVDLARRLSHTCASHFRRSNRQFLGTAYST
ncbi:hypothetical protein DAEQUDRAFT_588582 [Daedalea quercina L-15889]|uniref:Uncharacterized protein n=1 Tax=Daedalea quercina L-15889 TaxID=1314783 RepID=A0A165SUP4_9APHY|nr:hypothetical protein DAEQUDRAFT_588582 [Daedalea quercina L-15889]